MKYLFGLVSNGKPWLTTASGVRPIWKRQVRHWDPDEFLATPIARS